MSVSMDNIDYVTYIIHGVSKRNINSPFVHPSITTCLIVSMLDMIMTKINT